MTLGLQLTKFKALTLLLSDQMVTKNTLASLSATHL